MGILESFLQTEMGKSMVLPKPAEKPPAERDFEEEHRRDVLQAFGTRVLDGLPVRPIASVQARREAAEREKEAAALAAERAKVEAELAAGQLEIKALERKVAEAESARIRPEMRRIAAARMKKGKRELSLIELRERAVVSLAKGDKP